MPKKRKEKPSFEESIDFINQEINKRRHKWSLTSLNWMDFDDVSQIIRVHIYEKWHLYKEDKPLGPWLNRIISNQIKNLIRNNYGNYSRPCLKCAAQEGHDGCKIYDKQDSSCPLFARWEKTKKSAYNIKIPLSLEDHSYEVQRIALSDSMDIERNAKKLHKKMKEILKPNEWIVYEGLFIKNLEEIEVASSLGYVSTEKNRNPGYKQIKNLKKNIIEKVKITLKKGDVDFL
tara:strand:+ start:20666 stop:21361 length:696 start_codon:yes stop_codon:yes gene_type:complete